MTMRLQLALLLAIAVTVVRASCYIRVDQWGYTVDGDKDTKKAIIMSAGPITGNFTIVDNNDKVVATGVPQQIGGLSWGEWDSIYTADFSTLLTSTGTYTMEVSGCGNSIAFPVSKVSSIYQPLAANAVTFYQAQRDGPNVISSVLSRQPSHLKDETALRYKTPSLKANGGLGAALQVLDDMPHDVSGGWFDAGDYLKFVETTSYVLDVMLIALRDSPDAPNAGALRAEAQFGLDWLTKMWDPEEKRLCIQVGLGDGGKIGNTYFNGDHDLWRLPQNDDTLNQQEGDPSYYVEYRPVFSNGNGAASAKISPNLAGRVAAAFALCYQVFASSDSSYAQNCLSNGIDVFNLIDDKAGSLTSVYPFDYYPEEEWYSDFALGAVELGFACIMAGRAGDAPDFFKQAADYVTKYINQYKEAAPLNVYDVSPLAFREVYGGASTSLKNDIAGAMKMALDGALGYSASDAFAFGLPSYDGGSTVSDVFGLVVLGEFYREITKDDSYTEVVNDQRRWLSGVNPWGTSFVIGAGTVFPFCPQHQIANLVGSLNGGSPILLGGVVGGPSAPENFAGLDTPSGSKKCPRSGADPFSIFTTASAQYMDNVAAWPSVEPAIDYTAGSLLYFTRLVSRPKGPPQYTTPPSGSTTSGSKTSGYHDPGVSKGVGIALIVITVLLFVVVLALAIWVCVIYMR